MNHQPSERSASLYPCWKISLCFHIICLLVLGQVMTSLAGNAFGNDDHAKQVFATTRDMLEGNGELINSTHEKCSAVQVAEVVIAGAETEQKVKCKPPEERSCANKCDGEYGMLCPFSTVCDPIKHRCEKAQP